VVNKKRPLNPLKHTPSPLVKPSLSNINGQSLRSDAAAALARLADGVQDAGAGRIAMLSGYRSYSYQSTVYANKVASAGRAEADRWVARPGYSEHQTGLGTDVSPVGASNCSSYTCIGSTPQGRWIAANAWRYGFVVRYEKGQTSVTGYNAEPWHLRYVGTALARDYREGGWHSLEAYFGLPAAPSY
jgi:D-alanyl-D-alanine carboxypeptidase